MRKPQPPSEFFGEIKNTFLTKTPLNTALFDLQSQLVPVVLAGNCGSTGIAPVISSPSLQAKQSTKVNPTAGWGSSLSAPEDGIYDVEVFAATDDTVIAIIQFGREDSGGTFIWSQFASCGNGVTAHRAIALFMQKNDAFRLEFVAGVTTTAYFGFVCVQRKFNS